MDGQNCWLEEFSAQYGNIRDSANRSQELWYQVLCLVNCNHCVFLGKGIEI